MVSLDPSPEQIWDAVGSLFLALKAAYSTTLTRRLESDLGDHIITVPLGAARSLMWETGFNWEQISWKQNENDWGKSAITGWYGFKKDKQDFSCEEVFSRGIETFQHGN